jgi:hypothetical protein
MTRRYTTPGTSYKYLSGLVLLIAYGSLYPFDFAAAPEGAFSIMFSQATLFSSIGDALGNIGLFIPLGLLGVLTITSRRGMASAIVQTLLSVF